MLVERPDDEQWKEVVRTYGTPQFSDRTWNIRERTENYSPVTCSGEVILLIFNLAGSCIFVKRKGADHWFFPMGRIGIGEAIMDAARREAIEETGVKIEPLGVPLCQRVTLKFSNLVFQRWHLLVVAETETSVLEPRDGEEIAEARLFDTLPHVDDEEMMSWMHELHRAGTKYLRSLEVLDGI